MDGSEEIFMRCKVEGNGLMAYKTLDAGAYIRELGL